MNIFQPKRQQRPEQGTAEKILERDGGGGGASSSSGGNI